MLHDTDNNDADCYSVAGDGLKFKVIDAQGRVPMYQGMPASGFESEFAAEHVANELNDAVEDDPPEVAALFDDPMAAEDIDGEDRSDDE